jgi:hypothetical protein
VSQLAALAKPFAPGLVETKQGKGNPSYVAHDIVTQRLLAVVGPFDFRVDQLITDADGTVSGVLATLTCTVDDRTVSVTEVGCGDNPTSKTNGEKAKDATSDAIKRCAMRMGVALNLWAGTRYFLHDTLMKRESNG